MRLTQVPVPTPVANQVLVETRNLALNQGDVNDARTGRVPGGAILGSDIAGVVVQAAANGTGPAVGTPVAALAQRGFAAVVAADVASVAVLPAGVDLASAAALPVAGLAALRTLRASGSVLGRRVLITGASGGVGTFAVQLAAASGADVTAVSSAPGRSAALRDHGAANVVRRVEDVRQPVHVVIDTVGGQDMVTAWELLTPNGVLHSVGAVAAQPAVFEPYATVGAGKTLRAYLTTGDVGTDLTDLVALLDRCVLTVDIGWRGDVAEYRQALQALRDRRVRGKVVFDTTG